MIIFGIRKKILATLQALIACASCGHSSQSLYTLLSYFHIFWIPVVPVGKSRILECQHCRKVLTEKEFSPEQASQLANISTSVRTPAWSFIGVALIALFIVVTTVEERQRKEKTASYIQNPVAGDIAVMEIEKTGFAVLKILRVEKNQIFANFGKYVYKTKSAARSGLNSKATLEADYFSNIEDVVPVSKYNATLIGYVQRTE